MSESKNCCQGRYEVYIDIDDTLNSFTMHTLRHFGAHVSDFNYNSFPVECAYDIVSACNQLTGKNFNMKEFWNAIPGHVWFTCPKSEEYDLIFEQAETIAPRDQIFILTSPVKDGECHSHKYDWMVVNLPDWIQRQYFITPRKFKLAGKNRILIDDSDKNIIQWEAAGGIGILVPRPWNKLHGIHAYDYLKRELEKIWHRETVCA